MNANQPPTTPPPGWYRDPHGSQLLRWWNGTGWTAQTRPPAPTQPQIQQPHARPTPPYPASTPNSYSSNTPAIIQSQRQTHPGNAVVATPSKRGGKSPIGVIIALVIVAIIAVGVVIGVNAVNKYRNEQAFATSTETLRTTLNDLDRTIDNFDDAIAEATEVSNAAGEVLTSASTGVFPVELTSSLENHYSDLQTTIDRWNAPTTRIPTLPNTNADVTSDSIAALNNDITTVTELNSAYQRQTNDTRQALDQLKSTSEELLEAVPAVTQSLLDSNPLATNASKSALQQTAADIPAYLNSSSGIYVGYFVTDAQNVLTSQTERQAQPVDPVHQAVEDFAKSLTGGVPLDFEWYPIVNNFGEGNSWGATASWNRGDFRYSLITFSYSIGYFWPEPGVMATIAHETGHSIMNKEPCYTIMQGPSFNGDAEAFATAWAIHLGYDVPNGSGESLYGRPSDAQIAAVAQCQ